MAPSWSIEFHYCFVKKIVPPNYEAEALTMVFHQGLYEVAVAKLSSFLPLPSLPSFSLSYAVIYFSPLSGKRRICVQFFELVFFPDSAASFRLRTFHNYPLVAMFYALIVASFIALVQNSQWTSLGYGRNCTEFVLLSILPSTLLPINNNRFLLATLDRQWDFTEAFFEIAS